MNNRKVINISHYNSSLHFLCWLKENEAKERALCGGGKKSFPSRRPAGGTTQSASLCIVLSPQPCYGRRIFSFTPHVSDMTLTTREIQRFQQWQNATMSSEVTPCNLLFCCLRPSLPAFDKAHASMALPSLSANSLCFVSFFFSGRRKKERNEGKNFYYHTNHLGSTAYVTDQNQNITQGFLYAPFGEITTEYNANFGNNVLPKYSFNAKELDEETGMYYYEARYYKPPVFTSRDPMFEKYFWMTPYAYCANNPVKYVDPTGMDTLNVTYNNETNKWDISTPIVAAGNDVINVTKSNGIKGSVVFSEGEYGKRKCNVTLEDNGEQTLSVFMLSGAGIAGFAVEPSGVADNSKRADKGEIAPIECGIYNIGSVGGDKWKGWPEQYNNSSGSNLLSKGRGVAIHYAWSKLSISQKNLKAKKWTTKCAVVSSSYSKNAKGVVLFDGNESKAMAQKVAIYCGATGFKTRNKKYDQCVGIPSDCKVIRIVY